MKVKLYKTWFTPRGTRLRPGVHTMPDDWEEALPKSAEKFVEEVEVTKAAEGESETENTGQKPAEDATKPKTPAVAL